MNESELYFKAFQDAASIKTVLMWVTPAIATEWLEKNTHNRRLRPRGVRTYANEIRQGRWLVIHTGVAFDVEGLLVDGQTRLHAILEAGISIPLMVTFGLPKGSMEAVDRGMRRSIPDILHLEHDVERSNRVGPVVSILAKGRYNYDHVLTPGVAMEVYRQLKGGIDWVAQELPNRGPLWPAPVAAAFVVAWTHEPSRAAIVEFAKSYQSGESLSDGDPAFYMRRDLLERTRTTRISPWLRFRWTLNVLRRYVTGREIYLKQGVQRNSAIGLQYFTSVPKGGSE